jgi:hypothetical protein
MNCKHDSFEALNIYVKSKVFFNVNIFCKRNSYEIAGLVLVWQINFLALYLTERFYYCFVSSFQFSSLNLWSIPRGPWAFSHVYFQSVAMFWMVSGSSAGSTKGMETKCSRGQARAPVKLPLAFCSIGSEHIGHTHMQVLLFLHSKFLFIHTSYSLPNKEYLINSSVISPS